MRDFTIEGPINAQGDVIIHDQSNQYKPFDQCSNDELFLEEDFHYNRLEQEQHRTDKIVLRGFLFAVCLLFVTFIWGYLLNNWDMISGVSGVLGVLLAYLTLVRSDKPTRFQLILLERLQAIDDILRLRGVR